MEIRVDGWQESRAVTYPQKITVIRGRTPQVVMESTTYEFKDLQINSGLPDSAFEFDFRKIQDRFFYDMKTTKPYQLDSTGHRIAFAPRSIGIQGAVFIYHLIWISTLILLTWTGRLNWRSFVTRA